MRLVVECGHTGCALGQTAAQRLVEHNLKGLLRFPCDLREPVGKIVFECEGCPHRDIMMPLSFDVKMLERAQPSRYLFGLPTCRTMAAVTAG